ncbi:MAG: TolC family protein, partial [Sandarakinorhabdus sp.]|nr:TolC family protein [Sandarakinorhabdus sp.]
AAAAARVLERLALVRAEAGLATGLDVATAKADVAAADAGIEPIIAERAARVAALMRLTGLPTDRIAGLLIPVQPLLSADGWAISQVPANLLQRRPDVAASAARLAAADRDVATAVMARYPNVTLTGTLTWMTSTLSGLFLLEGITGGGGAVLAGPLLDFGRVAAEVERSRGVAAELAGLYRGTVLGALAEVEAALAEAKAARRQAAALGQSAAALDRARALAETAYRGGLTDARAAAEAARRLADARDRQLAAEALALDAALRLELAAGGGLGVPGLADAAGTAGQAGGIAKLTSRNN